MNTEKVITLLLVIFTATFLNGGENFKFEKVAENLKFPEGPAWDGQNTLYVSNCYGDWITKITSGKADTFILKPSQPVDFGKTNGLAFAADGNIYACDYGLGAILKISTKGKCENFLSGYEGKKFNRPNDLAFDPKGSLYFTDPKSYDKNNLDGAIYAYFESEKKLKVVCEGLGFPNGIAFSADAKFLYVCESVQQRILKFPVLKNGELENYSVFAELPGGDPDGIAFDVEGNLYVAHFGGGAIFVISPDGKIVEKIKTPGKKPTNVEFAGHDLKTLFITEAETNAVYKTSVTIPGVKLFYSPK